MQVNVSTAITIHYEFTGSTSTNLVAANNEPIAIMICSEYGVDCENTAEYTSFHTTGLYGNDYFYNFTPTFDISITDGYTYSSVINIKEIDMYLEFGSSGSQSLPFLSAGSGNTLTAHIMHKDSLNAQNDLEVGLDVIPLNEWVTIFVSAHNAVGNLEYSAGIFYANGTHLSQTGNIAGAHLYSSTTSEKCYPLYMANNKLLLRSSTYQNTYLTVDDFITKCSINGLCAAFDSSICLDAPAATSSFWKYRISPTTQCQCSVYPSGCFFCEDGFYFDSDSCKQCHALCKTCNGPLSTNCLTCTTVIDNVLKSGATTCECDSSLSLTYDESTNKCRCPTHQYLDAGSCLECYAACENCIGPSSNECESCFASDGVETSGASTCTLLQGYFYESSTTSIQKCFPSCGTCNGKTVNDCITCDESAGLIMGPDNVCVCDDADGFALNSTIEVCQCKEHFFAMDGKCQECDKLCGECSAPGTNVACISCTQGAILKGKVCACQSIDIYNDKKRRCVLAPKFLGIFIAVGLLAAGGIAALIVVLVKKCKKPSIPEYKISTKNKKDIE